jgi:hypothetical protein
MAKTLTISLPDSPVVEEIELSDGRIVEVLESARAREPETSWAARRPGWGDARGTSDVLIARAVAPRLSAAEVAQIEGRDRRRLMLAIVRGAGAERDWQRLYGTTLSVEERFVAVMRWARERNRANLVLGLREARQHLVEQAAPRVVASKPPGMAGLGALGALLGNEARFANMAKTMDLGVRTFEALGGFDATRFEPMIARAANIGVADHLRQADTIARLRMPKPDLSVMTKFTPLGLGKASELGKAFAARGAVSEMDLPGARIAEWSASRGILGMGDVSELGKAFAERGAIPGLAPMAAQIAGKNLLPGLYGFEKLGMTPDFTGLFPGAFGAEAAVGKMLEGVGGFGLGAEIAGFHEQFRRSYESLIVVEYTRVWASHPLWFLLGSLNPAKLPELVGRPREEVFEAVLDALEVVVRGGELATELLAAVDQLPFVTETQRQWLMYGLRHAHRGEWVQAVANLFLGFEGALHSGAVHAELIDPSGEGKLLAAEAIIKRSELSAELQDFAIKLVFGGRGNAFRHGRPEDEARDQVLLVLVALVGWIDVVLEVEGTRRLARELHTPLREAIERGEAQQP